MENAHMFSDFLDSVVSVRTCRRSDHCMRGGHRGNSTQLSDAYPEDNETDMLGRFFVCCHFGERVIA